MSDTQMKHQYFLVNAYSFRGKAFISGRGAFLFDENGKKYLDLMTNYGVNIFGYQNPKITRVLQDQLKLLPTLHCSFANDIRAQAASKLIKRCSGKLKKVYFSNSGTEAVEAALKFAILASNKKRIITMKGAYHGKSFGTLSITDSKKYRKGLEPLLWQAKFVPFGDIEALRRIINRKIAAIILEPIQGEKGVIIPPDGYLKAVQELCLENNIILIVDEVQTGTGRTGYFLASHKDEVKPDIVCLGKGLAGGIPIGATLVTKEIADKIPKTIHTSTFGGNPLACRGILEVLSLLDNKMLDKITSLGSKFLQGLKSLNSNQIIEVRGQGLMIAIKVKGDRNQVLKNLQQRGILACPADKQVVRFLPPYIITKKEIDKVIKVLLEFF